jgi:hypothetical protein
MGVQLKKGGKGSGRSGEDKKKRLTRVLVPVEHKLNLTGRDVKELDAPIFRTGNDPSVVGRDCRRMGIEWFSC